MKVKRTYNLDTMANAIERKYIPQMINDIADVIKQDITDGIANRKDIDNSPTKPLKEATIKAKKRKGYSDPTLPRVATSAMSGVLGSGGPYVSERAKPGKFRAIIRAAKKAFYGGYQQKTRPWWGIAKRTEKDVDRIIRTKGIQIVKSAHTGGLK